MSGSCSELEPFALRVIGDSMDPEFWDGCVIIIDPGAQAQNGSYVIVEYEGEHIFRQLWIEAGRRYLRPLNESYSSLELIGAYTIRGVVVQRAGRRRAQHKHYA
ncbi:MAG: LexA family protein [Acidiferrobacterales bacterium]